MFKVDSCKFTGLSRLSAESQLKTVSPVSIIFGFKVVLTFEVDIGNFTGCSRLSAESQGWKSIPKLYQFYC